jgi:glucosamine-6-phosphate deaminase
MNTSACRLTTRSDIATSSKASSSTRSILMPHRYLARTGWRQTWRALARRTSRPIADAGGVDLQILGIGTDGHIAFNEPGSSLASRTRIKTLTSQTRRDNARFFGGDVEAVPQHCLTQGIGTILQARHIVLVASGRGKAEAIHQLVEGPISAMWPASALQLHPHVTVLLDTAAASRLQLASYYIETYQGKPDWQGF